MKVNWRKLGVVMLALVLTLAVAVACAKGPEKKAVDYPTQDLTFIVTYKAGGGFDTIARMLSPYIEKHLPKKVNVVVKNVAGAGGTVGSIELYDSKPDGHTIGLLDPHTLCINQVLGKLGNRDVRKITWLGRVADAPFLMVLSAASPIKNIQDVKGKTVRVGTTTLEVIPATVLFKALGATEVKTVIYDGAPEACLAGMRGDLDAVFTTFPTLLKHVKASEGKLVPVMIGTEQRRPELPDTPTAKELGINQPAPILGCDRLLAGPPGIPDDVLKILNDSLQKAITDPEFIEKMDKAMYLPAPLPADQAKTRAVAVLDVFEQHKDILTATSR